MSTGAVYHPPIYLNSDQRLVVSSFPHEPCPWVVITLETHGQNRVVMTCFVEPDRALQVGQTLIAAAKAAKPSVEAEYDPTGGVKW